MNEIYDFVKMLSQGRREEEFRSTRGKLIALGFESSYLLPVEDCDRQVIKNVPEIKKKIVKLPH